MIASTASGRTAPRRASRLVATVLVALGVVACGGAGGAGGPNTVPAEPTVTVLGTDNKFDATAYSAPAGIVSFAYHNKGFVTHSLAVRTFAGLHLGGRLVLKAGRSGGLAVQLPPGSYDLYCDIAGHREAGMWATLTVT